MSRIVTVASGKGGVGKTWIAATLAQALAERGEAVLLIDADWGLANADVQLGVPDAPALPVTGSAADLAAAAVPVAGFHLLAGASGSGRLADLAPPVLTRLGGEIRLLGERYDRVIVDLASGAEAAVRRWWQLGDVRLLTLTPDPTSLTDAYALLKLCHRDGNAGAPLMVVNRAPSRAAGEATAQRLARAAASFLQLPVATAAILLEDPRVVASIRAQRPFLAQHPTSPMAAAFRQLAASL